MAIQEYQTKAGRRYRASLYLEGKRIATKRGFKTKKEAKQWQAAEERKYKTGVKLQKAGTAFGSVAEPYLTDMQLRRQPNTYSYKVSSINRFLEYMGGDFFLEELTVQDIDGFMIAQSANHRSGNSINRDIQELSICLNWAIRKDMYHKNPFRRVEPFPDAKVFVRHIPSAEDIAATRMAAEPEDRDWIDALYFTGARLGEIGHLRWEDINFEKNQITLWTRKRRGGRREPRHQAMPDSLRQMLWRRWQAPERHADLVFPSKDGEVLTHSGWYLRTLFTRVCKKAGVQRFTAHGIRHHVATRLKDSKKLTPYQIQQFLGHQNHRTTEIYLHELDVDPAAAAILEETANEEEENSKQSAV